MTAIPLPRSRRRSLPPPAVWFGGSMPAARVGLIINLLVPGLLLSWDALHHNLGVNAVNFAIKTTGLIAVTYLVLSLVVTPLVTITRLNWLVQFRRALGVYAFFYAAAHLGIYFWWDRSGDVANTFWEIVERRYLTIGFLSLALMLPLALTSFNSAIHWLGGRRWKKLHRLAYYAAILGCYHFYLQAKADKTKPDVYLVVLSALLLWRVVAHFASGSRRAGVMVAATPLPAGKVRFWKGELKVVAMTQETPSVRTFRLAMPDGSTIPFAFSAGQYLSLSIPIEDKRITRSYTIASSPTRDRFVELTIKREAGGLVSRYLHDMLMTDHAVSVAAPAGRFTFDPTGETGVTLIAGGVGITPAMSILRDLTDRGWSGEIVLIFIVRTAADIIFAAELRELAARHSNFKAHISITRDVPPDWSGPRGRLTPELLRNCVPAVAKHRAFVCGPDAMAAATREVLLASGVRAERITVESFTPAAAVKSDAGQQPASEMNTAGRGTISFARSGVMAQSRLRATVLDTAESVGVSIDYQCRAGICGTCRCKLLAGEVSMEVRDALSDADEADGYILACQARAVGDVTIDA